MCNIDITWQPRRVDWNAHAWTMTSLYQSLRVVHTIEWVCVLFGHHIQNDCIKQQICIKFCFKLEHSSVETIWMIQKAAVMDNWWLAASSWQWDLLMHHILCRYFGKTSNDPADSAPSSPDLALHYFWLFPELQSPSKGKKCQTVDEIQENMTWQLMVNGGTVWGPKVPALKRTEVSLSYAQFLVSCIFFSKCLYFSYYMA